MKFDWSEFTEADFTDYCAKMENNMLYADEYVGCCRSGELCFDLVLRELEKDRLTLCFDTYVGGENTGYGYSAKEALDTGKYKTKDEVPFDEMYPYDEADGDCFDDTCIWMTYEDFKAMAEDRISSFCKGNLFLMYKANMPLHIW